MKKLYYLLLLCLLFSQSCLKEENDLFSEPPAERMDKALKEYKEVLASSEKGWVLEYYAHPEQIYGGWNFIIKFTTSSATAYSDLSDDTSDNFESLYQLIVDDGPILTFDTYNVFLHFFSTPSSSSYQAYQGDYEFILMGLSEDKNEIQLKGKKTGNKMVLRRISETPESYLTKVLETQEKIDAPLYAIHFENKVYDCFLSDRILYFQYPGENNEIVTVEVAYCVTDKGIRLYSPVEINGITVQEFVADDTHLTSADGKITIDYVYIPVNQAFISSNASFYWDFDFDTNSFNVSDAVKTWIQQAQSYNSAIFGEQLTRIFFGAYNGKPSIRFYSFDGSATWQAVFNYTVSLVSDSSEKIKFGSSYVEDLNASFYPWFAQLVVAKVLAEGTYILTPNNIKNPSRIKFTSERDPDIWFYVYK
ncbi:MAG: DUF4302 domain-containing protein [Prevotella sp.]|jgi:hypothetical protein|nr:DUF4302 domain-containing protein [Prevotella sp.]